MAKSSSASLKEMGPGTDIESYAATRGHKTQTELHFTSHLEGMLKEGIEGEDAEARVGLTYGHAILAAIVYEKYDMAIAELDTILSLRVDYPDFGERAGRYIQHAKSLVRAIKAKRAIGKLPHVSRSKQKELVAALSHHFKELRTCILNIEKIERHARKEDISSTRWFMMSIYWSLFAIFTSGMLMASFPDVFIAVHQLLTHYLHLLFSSLANILWPIT